MSVKVWDVQCPQCGGVEYDLLFSSWDAPVSNCGRCGGQRVKLIGSRQRCGQWHARERVVVYRDPNTGDVKYPGRNDLPMPDRYRQQGYERVEMGDLATVTRFERETGTVNEAMHFNSGNGLADAAPAPPKVEYSDLLS